MYIARHSQLNPSIGSGSCHPFDKCSTNRWNVYGTERMGRTWGHLAAARQLCGNSCSMAYDEYLKFGLTVPDSYWYLPFMYTVSSNAVVVPLAIMFGLMFSVLAQIPGKKIETFRYTLPLRIPSGGGSAKAGNWMINPIMSDNLPKRLLSWIRTLTRVDNHPSLLHRPTIYKRPEPCYLLES